MSLDRLDAPLRMTWTAKHDRLSSEQITLLADKLGDSGLFYLTLQGDFPAMDGFQTLLEKFVERGVQLQLVVQPDHPVDQLTPDLPLQQVYLDCTTCVSGAGLDETALKQAARKLSAAGIPLALQMVPFKDNLEFLPNLFAFAARHGINRVSLPNVPLVDLEPEALAERLLQAPDLEVFKRFWAGLDLPQKPKDLIVHDLFLWEILCPEQGREDYSGCQAGNSLAHLDSSGILYPCSAWNQPLGSLFQKSVRDYWQETARFEVISTIAETPAGCHGCAEWKSCFGGCRGLSRSFGEENRGRDLMCPERRDP